MPLTKVQSEMIETSADVIAAKSIGYLAAGETVTEGTTLQEFIERLLTSTFYPTFVEPSAGLSSTGTPYSKEIGSKVTPTLTGSYTAGAVYGQMTNGVWLPNNVQSSVWTGAVTKYSFSGDGITGIHDNLLVANYTVGSEQTIDDNGLSYTVSIAYAAGVYEALNSAGEKKDANGNNYTVHASGTVTATVEFSGYRNLFYGLSSSSTDVPADNATATTIVRGLTSKVASPTQGYSFTLSPVAGTKRVMFAYPATLRDVSSVVQASLGYDVKGSFTKTTTNYNVEGANNYTGIPYKIYYFIPPSPFSAGETYTVTI